LTDAHCGGIDSRKSKTAAVSAGKEEEMKVEFSYGGMAFTVESESAVTVYTRAERGGGAARLAELRRGLSEEAARMCHDENVCPNGGSGVSAAAPVVLPDDAPQLLYEAEMDLLARLFTLRRRLAAEENVPAYVVFQDRTLKEMEEKKPKDLTALSALKGVGRVRLEKYGEKFLAVIKGAA
jgi:superfamily II DNA helicase RecQ